MNSFPRQKNLTKLLMRKHSILTTAGVSWRTPQNGKQRKLKSTWNQRRLRWQKTPTNKQLLHQPMHLIPPFPNKTLKQTMKKKNKNKIIVEVSLDWINNPKDKRGANASTMRKLSLKSWSRRRRSSLKFQRTGQCWYKLPCKLLPMIGSWWWVLMGWMKSPNCIGKKNKHAIMDCTDWKSHFLCCHLGLNWFFFSLNAFFFWCSFCCLFFWLCAKI